MKTFSLQPSVQLFDTFAEFVTETKFGPEDCLLTAKFLRDTRFLPAGVKCTILCFEDYGVGEPTDEMIDKIMADFRKIPNCKRVIGVGGGSILDIAKLLALKQNGTALQFFEKSVDLVKDRQLVLVPTTCGTGSEATMITITGIPSKGTKMGLAVPQLFADTAVLVPELVAGLPEGVMLPAAIDALVHAMESYVSPRSHEYTRMFAREAIRLIVRSFATFLMEGRKAAMPAIAQDLLLGSHYAGVAFGNTGVGAVHALSYPVGGVHHVPHGEANTRLLMPVFNAYLAKQPEGRIHDLTFVLHRAFGLGPSGNPWAKLSTMLDLLLPPKKLREYGMTEAEIEAFSDLVIATQQRLLVNNYVALSREEIRDIYKSAW